VSEMVFAGGNDQTAVFNVRVFRVAGVILLFVVAPAACASFPVPDVGVDGRAVEFIRPDELITRVLGKGLEPAVGQDEKVFKVDEVLSAEIGEGGISKP